MSKKSRTERLLNWMNTPVLAAISLLAFICLAQASLREQDRKTLEEHGITEERVSQYSSKPDAQPAEITDHLFHALIQTESASNQKAVSKAGAIGMTQLMPKTAKELGVNPHDREQNIEGGRRYLRKMVERFGDETLGLVAYNWGPTNVEKWLKRGGDWSKLPAETQAYVAKVKVRAAVAEYKVAQR